MAHEISIHEPADVLWAELRHLVLYLRGQGHERCEVLFGWHWGMDYYPSEWVAEDIPLAEVEAKIRQLEEADLGQFGGDDLYVKLAGLDCEFLFCHHEGIHLTSTQPNAIAEHFLERWRSGGLAPDEREVTPES